jgi:hypothetical protein
LRRGTEPTWIDPQFDVVQEDMERLAAKAKRLLEQLKASPEHYEEFKRDLLLDLISFRAHRDRPKN